MPVDRIFGRIDKELRNVESIYTPDEYIAIFSKHATVHSDVNFYDVKKAFGKVLQSTPNFKITEARRLSVTCKPKLQFGFSSLYNGDMSQHTLLRRDVVLPKMLEILPKENKLTPEKTTDMKKILKLISLNEAAQQYYKSIELME